ncbi:MAG: phosphotransferase family protein [Pseudomonadota bacterium]
MNDTAPCDERLDEALLDKAGRVRAGEEVAIGPLREWLEDNVGDLKGDMRISQYAGGASNWTYSLSFDNRALILRRPPKGTKAKGAHDMGREYRLQRSLKPVFDKVPIMLGYSDNKSVIGAEFYVMEKLNGIIPRREFAKGITLTPKDAKRLCEVALDELIALHNVDYVATGLAHIGKGAGYAERQINGWITRYQKARTWNVPRAKNVMQWLANNLPTKETICITHNDYRLDNLVLDPKAPSQIMGVLDWELATLGDPLMDVGNTLAYWIQADDDFFARKTRRQPTHLPGMMTRKDIVAYYCNKQDIDLDDFAFYEVYGLFRLAGIVQQIYYRFHHKQTRNPAYKQLWLLVHYLLYRCKKIIKR